MLLSDVGKKRAAQRGLKKRLAARASAAAVPPPATGNENIGAGEKPAATVEAEQRGPTLGEVAAELERARLFEILEELVVWENTDQRGGAEAGADRDLAELAPGVRRERRSSASCGAIRSAHAYPLSHDPVAAAGALPLEAQRLGLEAHASDLNPGGGADQQGDDPGHRRTRRP